MTKRRCLESCQALSTYSMNSNHSYYPFSEQLRNSLQSPFPDSGAKLPEFKSWELLSEHQFQNGVMVEVHVHEQCVCLMIIKTQKKKVTIIIIFVISLSSRTQISYLQSSGCFCPTYSHLSTAIFLRS